MIYFLIRDASGIIGIHKIRDAAISTFKHLAESGDFVDMLEVSCFSTDALGRVDNQMRVCYYIKGGSIQIMSGAQFI
jgi:hypothetical protein